MRVISICLALLAPPAAAHEFWIEPLEWQIGADHMAQARLVNGSDFEGVEFAYLPQRFARFDIYTGGQAAPVEGRLGNRPALQVGPLPEGLAVAAYVSTPHTVTYDDRAVFDSFVGHKDLESVASAHDARGLPEDGFTERYTRYSKALIAVGNAAGSDLRTGLETELVALDNPYADDLSDGLRVQLFYGDALRTDVQVELFERAPDGTVALTLHRTDEDGIATLPVRPGHEYLANAVLMREPSAEDAEASGAVWETLWAALTFAVPD